jgi:osmotically-inducible protein OsmY
MKLDLGQSHRPTPDSDAESKPPIRNDGVPAEPRPFLERAGDEVAAWFGNPGALSRRQRDEAVGDHSGKGPAGDSAADARLLAAVADRLTQDARLDASGIRITVISGSVTLHGSVITGADKVLAEKDAQAAGAGHVTNNLLVG